MERGPGLNQADHDDGNNSEEGERGLHGWRSESRLMSESVFSSLFIHSTVSFCFHSRDVNQRSRRVSDRVCSESQVKARNGKQETAAESDCSVLFEHLGDEGEMGKETASRKFCVRGGNLTETSESSYVMR